MKISQYTVPLDIMQKQVVRLQQVVQLLNRVQTKVDSAILPEWKNTLRYEAEIVIPKGTTLNIGRVGEQFTMSGTRLAGDADQFLLPQNWDLNWIKRIREVKP